MLVWIFTLIPIIKTNTVMHIDTMQHNTTTAE